MVFVRTALSGAVIAVALLLTTGCAPKSYAVRTPAPSSLPLEVTTAAAPTKLSLQDRRPETEREFSGGVLKAQLTIGGRGIEPAPFLAEQTQAELASRGIPAEVRIDGTADPSLLLNTFRVQNWRSNGFSPFVTFTYLSADLQHAGETQRIGVFVKAGKVPVWSFDEVVEPTFNRPLSIAVREFASKVASRLYGVRASDAEVDRLIAKARSTNDGDTFLDVYALGFSNNPRAIDTLVQLTRAENEYVRLAAISSLGNLRAEGQFDLLKSIYADRSYIWQDRAMALKSIGDLGTADAKAFLAQELKRWQADADEKEAKWTLRIIQLYLP